MIFNPWRKYSWFKPKKEGWYTCTVRIKEEDGKELRRVIDLYYIPWMDRWFDDRRQSVFKGYVVYLSGRGQLEGNRVYDDRLCDLTKSVIAWKKLPKPCGWWKTEVRIDE